jgi:hypothetical protein
MKYYENLAEMYVGDDVSPDFYGWVFPKYDHVAVGTGERLGCRKKGGKVDLDGCACCMQHACLLMGASNSCMTAGQHLRCACAGGTH